MFLRAKENNLPSDPSTIQALKMAAGRNLDLFKSDFCFGGGQSFKKLIIKQRILQVYDVI